MSDVRPDDPEPVLGWRLWKLHGDHLRSWGLDYDWNSGGNRAICLAPPPVYRLAMGSALPPFVAARGLYTDRRHQAPGRGCGCGFWGGWRLERSLSLARRNRNEIRTVLGLMVGWGVVAIHGKEGFRAERARVACLFTDWVWDLQPKSWHFANLAWVDRWQLGRLPRPPEDRATQMIKVAAHYGVPLISLADAAAHGVLKELGAGQAAIDEVVAAVAPRHSARN